MDLSARDPISWVRLSTNFSCNSSATLPLIKLPLPPESKNSKYSLSFNLTIWKMYKLSSEELYDTAPGETRFPDTVSKAGTGIEDKLGLDLDAGGAFPLKSVVRTEK